MSPLPPHPEIDWQRLGWLAVEPVIREPVSTTNSRVTGRKTGSSFKLARPQSLESPTIPILLDFLRVCRSFRTGSSNHGSGQRETKTGKEEYEPPNRWPWGAWGAKGRKALAIRADELAGPARPVPTARGVAVTESGKVLLAGGRWVLSFWHPRRYQGRGADPEPQALWRYPGPGWGLASRDRHCGPVRPARTISSPAWQPNRHQKKPINTSAGRPCQA
jgi:hypothetical protein